MSKNKEARRASLLRSLRRRIKRPTFSHSSHNHRPADPEQQQTHCPFSSDSYRPCSRGNQLFLLSLLLIDPQNGTSLGTIHLYNNKRRQASLRKSVCKPQ